MHKKKYHSLIVLIPSFNELHNLKKFIIKLNKHYKVLIVDDCSSDNTFAWLKKNKINFIKNKFNLGYEQSLIKGFKYIIRSRKIKKIITMDADGQHDFKNIENFMKLDKKNELDLIIGQRNKKNRQIEKIISNVFYKKFRIMDPLTGFKMYNLDKLKKINFTKLKNLFLVDLLLEFIKKGFKIRNVSIKIKKRTDYPKVGGFFRVNLKMMLIFINVLFN